MTKTSLLPKIAKSVGMDYPTLCEAILEAAV
jgi:D-alanine-D-alanine ligase-like ATP-grasp enzyme